MSLTADTMTDQLQQLSVLSGAMKNQADAQLETLEKHNQTLGGIAGAVCLLRHLLCLVADVL